MRKPDQKFDGNNNTIRFTTRDTLYAWIVHAYMPFCGVLFYLSRTILFSLSTYLLDHKERVPLYLSNRGRVSKLR